MDNIFKDEFGNIVSTVNNLTPQLEVETVLHGKKQAEYIRLYLDGDRIAPAYGPSRPCVRIQFAPDGKTVTKISLLNDPLGDDFVWER